MFPTTINNIALSSEAAEEFFPSIGGTPFRDDTSFLATMRAILPDVLPEGEKVFESYASVEARSGYSVEDVVENIRSLMNRQTGVIQIISVGGVEGEKVHNWLKENTIEELSAYQKDDRAAYGLREAFKLFQVYTNSETKNTIIITDSMTTTKWHSMQMMMFRFFPWYFKDESGKFVVSDKTKDLLRSFLNKDSSEYVDKISQYAEKYDFRTAEIKKKLSGFEHMFEKYEVKNLEKSLEQKRGTIIEYEERIRKCATEIHDVSIRVLGLKASIASRKTNDELMQYFLASKDLHLLSVEDSNLYFAITGYLDQIDETYLDYMKKPDGMFFTNCEGTRIPYEDMRALLLAIYEDRVFRIRCCSAFSLDLRSGVEVLRQEDLQFKDYPPDVKVNRIPNPHLYYYGCAGANRNIFDAYFADGEYISCIETCVASNHSLSMTDSSVVPKFTRYLIDHCDEKFIETKDYEIISPLEALKILKEAAE